MNKVIVRCRKHSAAFLVLTTMLVSHSSAASPLQQNAPMGARPAQAKSSGNAAVSAQKKEMRVRISEIGIDPNHLAEYKALLKEEAEASVRLEAGVVAIFPMYEKDDPAQVRILEIYASREAYESHLKTPHFQKYKTTTLKMVKSLRLVDMEAIDAETMTRIFRKMNKH